MTPSLSVLLFIGTALVTGSNLGWGEPLLTYKALWMGWVFPWLGLLNQDLKSIPGVRGRAWVGRATLLVVLSFCPLCILWPIPENLPGPLLFSPLLTGLLLLGLVRNRRARPWPAWNWSGGLSLFGFLLLSTGMTHDGSPLGSINAWIWFRSPQQDWMPFGFCLITLAILWPWIRLCELVQKSNWSLLSGLIAGLFFIAAWSIRSNSLAAPYFLGIGLGLLTGALDRFTSSSHREIRVRWVRRQLSPRLAVGFCLLGLIWWLTWSGLSQPASYPNGPDLPDNFPRGQVLTRSELEKRLNQFRNPLVLRAGLIRKADRPTPSTPSDSALIRYASRTANHLFESVVKQFLGKGCWNQFHVVDLTLDGSDNLGLENDWWQLENRRAEWEVHRYYYQRGHLPKEDAAFPAWVRLHLRSSYYHPLGGEQYDWSTPTLRGQEL